MEGCRKNNQRATSVDERVLWALHKKKDARDKKKTIKEQKGSGKPDKNN